MSEILTDEPSIVEQILNHIDRKTTDLSEGIWREPVEHYTSPQRYSIEIEKVFRRTRTPFSHVGTFETWRDVRLESGFGRKAEVAFRGRQARG
jgi:hypothetical protein